MCVTYVKAGFGSGVADYLLRESACRRGDARRICACYLPAKREMVVFE